MSVYRRALKKKKERKKTTKEDRFQLWFQSSFHWYSQKRRLPGAGVLVNFKIEELARATRKLPNAAFAMKTAWPGYMLKNVRHLIITIIAIDGLRLKEPNWLKIYWRQVCLPTGEKPRKISLPPRVPNKGGVLTCDRLARFLRYKVSFVTIKIPPRN